MNLRNVLIGCLLCVVGHSLQSCWFSSDTASYYIDTLEEAYDSCALDSPAYLDEKELDDLLNWLNGRSVNNQVSFPQGGYYVDDEDDYDYDDEDEDDYDDDSKGPTPQDAYDEGYKKGYNDGYDDGKRGFAREYSYNASTSYYGYYETRYREGYRYGYNLGYNDGYRRYEEDDW